MDGVNFYEFVMPAILGPFESSLRGRGSGAEDDSAKKILHHSCSGASHGYGVKKERQRLEREQRERRNCSLPPDISASSGHCHVPDILLDSLQSGPGMTRCVQWSEALTN